MMSLVRIWVSRYDRLVKLKLVYWRFSVIKPCVRLIFNKIYTAVVYIFGV